MTTPRQVDPTDPQLSRLYREHAQSEPSAAVDQRILAAARQALAAPKQTVRRKGAWERWRLPLTLVTSVMLTASLALQIERQPKEPLDIPDIREAGRAQDRVVEATKPAEKRAESASTTEKTQQAPAARATAAPSQANTAGPSGFSADRERAPALPFEKPAKAENQPLAVGVSSEAVEAAKAVETAKGVKEMRSAPAPSTARPAAAELKKSRADNVRPPEAWLDEIRSLRRAGQHEEAERQLREFRLAYPAYALPEEFRQK